MQRQSPSNVFFQRTTTNCEHLIHRMALSAIGQLYADARNQLKSTSTAASNANIMPYLLQWGVLVLLVCPLLVLAVIVSLPLAVLLWATGAVEWGKNAAAERDPVLAKVLSNDEGGAHPLLSSLTALARVYTSLVGFAVHLTLRLFVRVARPRTVFVVYTSNYTLMRRFFCVGTGELLYRTGISKESMRPETPWVFMMGIIHVGTDVGFGVYGALCPALSHVTDTHLHMLPAAVRSAFPAAESIALAGRLPGLMTAAGVPIKAPIVDGLSGTVFAMEATVHALVANLPPQRRSHPTVAILGGGGYIGARLVSVLATRAPGASSGGVLPQARRSTGKGGSLLEPQSSFNLEVEPETAAGEGLKSRSSAGGQTPQPQPQQQQGLGPNPAVGMRATVTLREAPAPRQPATFRQIIALDTRFAGQRHTKAGVLYTAEPQDLEAADVVLVITRNGDDVNGYVKHAQPGQEWGDDTHPEIGRAVLQQLAARGVNVHKAMATRSPPTRLLPPLPGWPVAGTPGCLLMAIVSAATHTDWNGAGTRLVAGQAASEDAYWAFAEATRKLGVHAMLTKHRRSKMDKDTAKEL